MNAPSSGGTYKCLAVEQSRMTEVRIIKDSLRKEYEKRLHVLDDKSMVKAMNTCVLYSFGVIHWSDT